MEEHWHLVQQEAKMHIKTAEDERRRDRLARSARAPSNSGARMALAAAYSRLASAARVSAEMIRLWLASPSEPQEQCC